MIFLDQTKPNTVGLSSVYTCSNDPINDSWVFLETNNYWFSDVIITSTIPITYREIPCTCTCILHVNAIPDIYKYNV